MGRRSNHDRRRSLNRSKPFLTPIYFSHERPLGYIRPPSRRLREVLSQIVYNRDRLSKEPWIIKKLQIKKFFYRYFAVPPCVPPPGLLTDKLSGRDDG